MCYNLYDLYKFNTKFKQTINFESIFKKEAGVSENEQRYPTTEM